jgi:hypothetical protein
MLDPIHAGSDPRRIRSTPDPIHAGLIYQTHTNPPDFFSIVKISLRAGKEFQSVGLKFKQMRSSYTLLFFSSGKICIDFSLFSQAALGSPL